MLRLFLRFTLLAIASGVLVTAAAKDLVSDKALWTALKGGNHIVLLRHAQTVPGTGDPPGYKLDDCKTQRGLNDVGRTQARAWGSAFTQHGVPVGGVFSSVWCRCVDTAKLAFGRVETWPGLNSHFDTPHTAALQAEQVRGGLPIRMQQGKNLVLVTHQVNITTLTGLSPAMGEAVVLRMDGKDLIVLGRLSIR